MLQINGLRFRYGQSGFQLAIDELGVASGEKVAIVGPSGSGKTTLLNLISGIVLPDTGDVAVAGQAVGTLSDAERRRFRIQNIGFVFQQFELVDYLSVRENIELPFLINPAMALTADVKARVESLAASTGLTEKLSRPVRNLSRGEQQRVAICRALLPSPTLILADEPTGNLDPSTKASALSLLFEQCERHSLTLIAVTHDHTILDKFDRVVDFVTFMQPEVTP